MYLILHAELALSLRLSSKLARVAEHVVESDFSSHRELVVTDFTVKNRATAGGDATDYIA